MGSGRPSRWISGPCEGAAARVTADGEPVLWQSNSLPAAPRSCAAVVNGRPKAESGGIAWRCGRTYGAPPWLWSGGSVSERSGTALLHSRTDIDLLFSPETAGKRG